MTRRRLPDNRHGLTAKVEIGGIDLYVTVNFYDNDQPGEVFVKASKHGSTVGGLLDTISVLISMLLQTGVPLSRVADKLMHTQFDPSSEDFSSLVDAIARTAMRLTSDVGGLPDLDADKKAVEWRTVTTLQADGGGSSAVAA